MIPLKVYTDIKAPAELLAWLQAEIHPHHLLLPTTPGDSVLAEAPPDPQMQEADVLLGQPSLAGVCGALKARWLQVSSAGFTRYDTPEFRNLAADRNLLVTNSSSVYDQACAEHVFAFMLAQSRLLPTALAATFPNGSREWLHLRNGCRSLQGERVLIAGYGAIAARLVRLLEPFGMRLVAMRRQARGDEGMPVISAEAMPEALAEADHVVNILPENAGSRNYFSTSLFEAMKPGAVFYNIGRGTTVDQSALYTALHQGRLSAAWLDVTEPEPLPDDHPLRTLPNCHITPHIAGGHQDETRTLLRHFLDNFQRFLKGDPLVNRVI